MRDGFELMEALAEGAEDRAELIAEAEARIDWLWDNLPDDDGARDYEHAAELAELTEYLRAIGVGSQA